MRIKKNKLLSLLLCFILVGMLFLGTPATDIGTDEVKADEQENLNVTAEYMDIIDETKPLSIRVKLENGKWYSSENLEDLSLVDPKDIVYYFIDTPYGAIGFYTAENNPQFGHSPIVYSPLLDNGTILDKPVGGMYLKLWIKAGGQWYQKYITDRNLGYDYREYMEFTEISENCWALGWNITGMTLTVAGASRQFDIYAGIQVNASEKFAKIKQKVTPYDDYQDIGLEWICLTSPAFVGTEYALTSVMAQNDTWQKQFNLDQFKDISVEIPDYVKKVYLQGENGVAYHTFDFQDLNSYGLDGTELFRVEEMTLPDNESEYVVRVGATKGEGISAYETLDIDPEISISDEVGYCQITTGTYAVRISDKGRDYYWILNGRNYATSPTEGSPSHTLWLDFLTAGGDGMDNIEAETFSIAIEEDDSDVRVKLNQTCTIADWGGSGVSVDITILWYFYNDYYSKHITFYCVADTFERVAHQAVTHISNVDIDDVYTYGNSSGHSNGTIPGSWTNLENSYADFIAKHYLIYDNGGSDTETLAVSLIYDDMGACAEDHLLFGGGGWVGNRVMGYIDIADSDTYELAWFVFFSNDGGGIADDADDTTDLFKDYERDQGAAMQTPTTGTYTGWDQDEILYELECAGDSVAFDIDCLTNADAYYPVFKLTNYTDTEANFKVELEGVELSNGSDYIVEVNEATDIALVWYNGTISADNQTFEMGALVPADVTPPSITSPSDIAYTVGDTGNSIEWTVTETNEDSYNITKGAVVVDSGSYSSGVPISINVDSLTAGSYTYILGANDTTNNSASDTVLVVVSEASEGNGGNGGSGNGDSGDNGGGDSDNGGDETPDDTSPVIETPQAGEEYEDCFLSFFEPLAELVGLSTLQIMLVMGFVLPPLPLIFLLEVGITEIAGIREGTGIILLIDLILTEGIFISWMVWLTISSYLAIIVYQDAKRCYGGGRLWFSVVFFSGLLGLTVYLVIRKAECRFRR